MDQHDQTPHRTCTAFTSLRNAIDYVDSISSKNAATTDKYIIDMVQQIKCAYREFPELDILRPRADLFGQLWANAGNAAETISAALLIALAGFAPAAALPSVIGKICEHNDSPLLAKGLSSAPAARSGDPSRFTSLLHDLIKRDKNDLAITLISHIWPWRGLVGQTNSRSLEDLLERQLGAQAPDRAATGGLVAIVESTRRRLGHPTSGGDRSVTREALLARSERLRALVRPNAQTPPGKSGWPSGTMRFDEFVLQWPCEVELADNLDDETFVTATYRAVLLRAPLATEMQQWLRLLHAGDIDRAWLIEDLLASPERHAIRRQVRVIWQGRIIAGPETILADETLPTVTLPIR